MKNFVLFFLVTSFFVPILAPAQSQLQSIYENAQMKLLCTTSCFTCKTPQVLPPALKTAIFACETVAKSTFCQELVKKEPEFYGHTRRCEPEQFCSDHLAQEVNSITSCGLGFLEGTGEMFAHVWDSIDTQNKLIATCNDSLECKRDMVKDIPKFQKMSDKELSLFTAAMLKVEKENYEYIQSTFERQSVKGKTLSERAEEMARRKNENTPRSSNKVAFDKSAFLGVQEWLLKKDARLDCLDAKTRAEMICWGAAYIIDPIMVAGLALKGGKIAKYIVGAASTDEKILVTISAKSKKFDAENIASLKKPGVDARALREQTGAIWKNSQLSVDDKVRQSFEEYVRLRTSELTEEKRKLAEAALKDIKARRGADAFYDRIKKRIYIGDQVTDDLLSYLNVLSHELEHLSETVSVTQKKVLEKIKDELNILMSKPNKRNSARFLKNEFEAIGAQWDFLQSIPGEVRAKAIENLKANNRMSPGLKKTLIADLEMAGLSREEFLRIVPEAHNYSSLQIFSEDHDADRLTRMMFIYVATASAMAYSTDKLIQYDSQK